MRVHFLGDERLHCAIRSLFEHHGLEIELRLKKECCQCNEQVNVTIIDSRWFKRFMQTSCSQSTNYIIIIGAYTDAATKDAFLPDARCRYVAYSELESQLLPNIHQLLELNVC